MERSITHIIQEAILEKVFPGCVVGVVWRDGRKIVLPFGHFTYEADSSEVKADTIFDVASVTKSIPTACLALQLIEQRKLSLTDQLVTFIPELRTTYQEAILIKHLLTHTLDFGLQLSSLKDKSPDEILECLFTAPLRNKPGQTYAYINATSILLGIVINRATGKALDQLAKEQFFVPLGMQRTTFHPEQFPKEEIVPTEIDSWRGRVLQGEVHDESAYVLSKKQIVGSAGLFSTASDLLRFLQMLLQKGTFAKRHYFSDATIRQMHTDQIGTSGYTGLGWQLYQPRFMGQYCTPKTFGKTGFTGCVVICDIEKGVAFTILSNYTYPHRKADKIQRDELFAAVADVILRV